MNPAFRFLASSALFLACAQPPFANASSHTLAAERIAADVGFLADDLLEGRGTGTRGYDLAAAYVAARYRALGLEPAGDKGSYLQRVPLVEALRSKDGARFEIERNGKTQAFTFETDFVPGTNYLASTHLLTAPLVFVGQAVHAPELGHDDFAGVDVRGKIAVVLGGAPERFEATVRASHASNRTKQQTLAQRGAVGIINLATPDDEPKVATYYKMWSMPQMRLLGKDGKAVDAFPEIKATASLRASPAAALFEGAPMTAEQVFAALKTGELKSFDLIGTATLGGSTTLTPRESFNVVGRLPGTDKALADEHIAYTAHLDHLGIGREVDGDSIYNGAFDNALGVSIMLEAARELAAKPARRSQVFVALTAEEKGLLGGEHFASNPSTPGELVANINMDMPVMLTGLSDVIPIGVDHSSLGADVRAVTEELGITLTADPWPEQNLFVRSDQWAFIRQGIPAIYLINGVHAEEEGVDAKAQFDDFLSNHYHQPSDETDLAMHYPSAVVLARLNALIGQRVGNADARPQWKPGDVFGELYGKKAAKTGDAP